MFKSNISWRSLKRIRFYSDKSTPPPQEHPVHKTIRILGNDMKAVMNKYTTMDFKYRNYDNKDSSYYDTYPSHADIVIIGGGVMGSSIAYWLKARAATALSVVVIEKDHTYKEASTVLSVGGLRQQFSLPENIQMSQYAAEFFKTVKKDLGEDVDLQFTPYGYLLLANEENAQQLIENHNLQKEHKVKNVLLNRIQLKQKFPWLNTDDIELGCLGLEDEGWFDPWTLLYALKRRAIQLGVEYVDAEATGFTFENSHSMQVIGVPYGEYNAIRKVIVKRKDGNVREIGFANVILAAGASSGKVAKLANIGTGKGMLGIPIPVEPRKRYVYCFSSQDKNIPGVNTPMTFDPSGTYFRREGLGNTFIGGRAPSLDNEPSTENLEVDHEFFNTDVWPCLAHRVPAFEGVKVNSAWAGYYEFNTYDENGIIGMHPYHINMLIATGFSGHGIQQAPAVGRAISELIIDGEYKTIDLSRLAFDRILQDVPMYETNIF